MTEPKRQRQYHGPCSRPGCAEPLRTGPRYCSRACAVTMQVQARGHAFYQAIGVKSGEKRRQVFGGRLLLAHELRLMTQGRYQEAARLLLHRGYTNGRIAGRKGLRVSAGKVA